MSYDDSQVIARSINRDDWIRPKRRWRPFAIVALIAALAVPVAVVEGSSETKVCPDGQELVSGQAGALRFENRKPPPEGFYYSDSVSGDGPDVSVRSDRDSATVEGDVALEIACR